MAHPSKMHRKEGQLIETPRVRVTNGLTDQLIGCYVISIIIYCIMQKEIDRN